MTSPAGQRRHYTAANLPVDRVTRRDKTITIRRVDVRNPDQIRMTAGLRVHLAWEARGIIEVDWTSEAQ